MLGEALRLTRVFHDRKTGELAEALGLSASFISEIEKGDKTPSMETLKKYAVYFDTTVSALMFFAEDLEKPASKKSAKDSIRKKLIRFLQIVENETA
jgi:transcriptional regulator with XRE-family HTH domain